MTAYFEDIDIEREMEAMPCPDCKGFSNRDNKSITKKEIRGYQTCGRSYACCIAAFVCQVCGSRFIVNLHAPEMESFGLS